jgi:putrescine transport system permease protein
MNWRRILLIGTPYLWLILLFLFPFAIVLRLALSDTAIAIPPYVPLWDVAAGWAGFVDMVGQWDFEKFAWLVDDDLYLIAYLTSLRIALVATILTLLVGFPIAYAMAKAPEHWRPTLMMLVILPFWSSFLIRVYAWVGILSNQGLLNQFLLWTGVISEPLRILNTDIAVYIGTVYTYLPFAILPIYANLEKLDASLLEAAEDLGCSRTQAFWLIVIPLARPGLIAAAFLVFIPVVGEFVIPSLLGGPDTLMIGRVLYDEFFSNRDWPVASAVAVILLLILIIPIVLFQRQQEKQREAEQ